MVGASFTEEVLTKFIDYVAYQPRLYCFNKVKFVAAMNHLIIMHRPAFTKHFADSMPGMANYAHGGGGAPGAMPQPVPPMAMQAPGIGGGMLPPGASMNVYQ